MKKLLLASVATVAVAAFAAGAQAADASSGLKLGLGGYFSVQGGYAAQSDGVTGATAQPGHNVQKADVFEYGELHFSAEKSFDNGLTAGYRAVLEVPVSGRTPSPSTSSGAQTANATTGTTSPTVAVRQDYGYFSGNWGRFEAGQNYSPVYYMAVSAPSVNDEFDSIDPDFNLVNITPSYASNTAGLIGTGVAAAQAQAINTKNNYSGQFTSAGNYATVGMTPFYKTGGMLGDKVVYYTPRFNGFQLGADYQPDQDRTGDGTKSATSGFIANQTSYQQTDRAEIGVAYDGKFSGVGVKVGGGYAHADAGTQVALTNSQLKDEQAWTGGAQLSYMNWTLGGGYLWDNNGQSFSATTSTKTAAAGNVGNAFSTITADGETNTWNAGLGYAVGPYHAGVSYYDSQIDVLRNTGTSATTTYSAYKSTDKLDRWVVGGGYGVAPGVDLNTTLQFDKYQTADSALNPTGNNNATVFTVGTTVNF
jgi:predicted porin